MYVVTISLYYLISNVRTLVLDTYHRSSSLHRPYRSFSCYAPSRSSILSSTPSFARIRRHFLPGARALLGRVFSRFRRSQSSTAEPTELLRQCSMPGDVSIPGPADVAVTAAQDNQVCHALLFLRLPNANDLHRPPSPMLHVLQPTLRSLQDPETVL